MGKAKRPYVNFEVKQVIKSSAIPQWLIAEFIGVHPVTLSHWLNWGELTDERKSKVVDALCKLTGQDCANGRIDYQKLTDDQRAIEELSERYKQSFPEKYGLNYIAAISEIRHLDGFLECATARRCKAIGKKFLKKVKKDE